jgi:SepF-like predicted cell division protein (DUF552 family)
VAGLSLLVLGSGAIGLIARRKEEEDFWGNELTLVTTYVHYELVREARDVLAKMIDGASVRRHTPFVVQVCRHSLNKARAGIITTLAPDKLTGHIDWVTAELYSRIVDVMAAAMFVDVPVTMTEHGHIRVMNLPDLQTPPASLEKVQPAVASALMPITPMIVQERGDILWVLNALRQGPTVLLLEVRFKEDDLKRFIRLVKRTAHVHHGRVLGLGNNQYLVTSDVGLDTSTYERAE